MLTKTRIDEMPEPVHMSSRRPLIVHVVRQFLPNRGGLEDVVYNLCQAALKKGYRIRVVTLDRLFSDPGRTLPAHETIDGIEVTRIAWKGSSRYPLAPSVLRHIEDADLVHVHAVDFFFDFLSLTQLLHRKPMIATTHGGFFHTKRFAAVKAIWFQTLTRFSAARYRTLVGCSQSDVETFAPIAGKHLKLIANGADTTKFHDRAAAEPTRRLVTIGRFSVNKRLDNLILTMRTLVDSNPQWHLDIVGVASDLSGDDVQALIDANDLGKHVTLHVGISNPEIAAVIGNASLLVSASEYEGFGLVAIEGMSAGLMPVLQENDAYRALASRHDIVTITDFAEPGRAATDILTVFERLKTDPQHLRRRLISDSDLYSWNEVAKQYFSLYANALAGKD